MTLQEVRTPGETRFFERRHSEVSVTHTSKFAYVLSISFEKAEDCFFKFQTLLLENGKKRWKKQFIAQSDRAERVDFALKGPKLKKNGPKLNFEFQKSLLVNQRTMFCRLSMYLQFAPEI